MELHPHGAGSGPDVVLVHGVGLSAGTFAAVLPHLGGVRAWTVDRPGYGSASAMDPVPLDAQVHALVQALDAAAVAAPVLVGVSGGATLAVAAALAVPDRWAAVVAHEPLLGPLAAGLHAAVSEAAARLVATGPTGAERFLRDLVGPATWSALPAGVRAAALSSAVTERLAADVSAFVAFSPTSADLARLRPVAVTATLGSRSGPTRVAAARLLHEVAHAAVVSVPGAGHLAHVDEPAAFASIVRGVAAATQ